ncbi:hypothetical protein H9Y04_12200 [Streptomyces sp. TRM66268-LWL]|uniref:Peptidase M60 domain-containing protein n=1 Tax=Streptomyces polyasparticus TaxID=2767826 RepID=A0ABR7SCX0_9ACTN|nr:M60 family metallopeptidase [Streptomyces polyasparticus]MBC9713331.1 hypothetical protein [Streptomyces polyasparticus]
MSPTSARPGRRAVLTAAAAAGVSALLPTARPAGAASIQAVTLNLTARTSAASQRTRLACAMPASDYLATGAYVPAGVRVTLAVSAPDGLVPKAVVGIPDPYGTNARSYTLSAGTNTLTDAHGGPLQLIFIGSGEQAAVTLGTGILAMPTFVHGTTSESTFQWQLDNYPGAGYVQLRSAHALVTLSRATALTYRGENHATLLDAYETVLASHATFSGLSGTTGLHARNPLPYHFVNVTKVPDGWGAFASSSGFMGFPDASVVNLASESRLRTAAWGTYHELGHQHQQSAVKPAALTEVTNNLYALYAQRTLGLTSRLLTKNGSGLDEYDQAFAARNAGTAYADLPVWAKLVPLWQLYLASGVGLWQLVHRHIRTDNPPAATDADRYDNLAVYASRAMGRDLTGFFADRWRYPLTASGRSRIAALGLNPPSSDLSTLRE